MASTLPWTLTLIVLLRWSASAQQCGMAADFRSYSNCINSCGMAPPQIMQQPFMMPPPQPQIIPQVVPQMAPFIQQTPCSAQIRSTPQCPPGTYLHNNFCIPHTNLICPPNTVYTNGVCQAKPTYQCPPDYTFSNGICVKNAPPPTPCSANIRQNIPVIQPEYISRMTSPCGSSPCSAQTLCPPCENTPCPNAASDAFSVLAVQECPSNMILYNGTCVSQSVARCPEGSHLERGKCFRDAIPADHVNEIIPCPFGTVQQGRICVKKGVCPEDTLDYNGLCVKCPEGEIIKNGMCVEDTESDRK